MYALAVSVAICVLSLSCPAGAIEIRIDKAGSTVSTRAYQLQATAEDSIPITALSLQLNGVDVEVRDFTPMNRLELQIPVELQFGLNLISIRAKTGKGRSHKIRPKSANANLTDF